MRIAGGSSGGLVLLWLLAVACSSDGEGSAGGGGISCEDACTKADSLACANADPHATCVTECEGDRTLYGTECSGGYSSYLGCIVNKGTLICDADGEPSITEDVETLCRSELQSFAACGACVSQASDSACLSCAKQSCCSQIKAFVLDPAFLEWDQCGDQCSDAACEDACDTQYASVKSKVDAATTCAQNECAAQCGATP